MQEENEDTREPQETRKKSRRGAIVAVVIVLLALAALAPYVPFYLYAERLRDAYDELLDSFKKQTKQLEDKNAEILESLNGCRAELAALGAELEKAQGDLLAREAEFAQNRKAYEHVIKLLQAQNRDLKQKIQKQDEVIKQKEQEIVALKVKLGELYNKFSVRPSFFGPASQ